MPTTKKRVASKGRDIRGQKLCPHCGALMPARWFDRHLAEKHGSAAEPAVPRVAQKRHKKLRCPHCDKTFANLSGLASHLHYLHPNKSALERHTEPSPQRKSAGATVTVVAAKTGAQTLPRTKSPACPQCGKRFTAPHRLAQHIQYRHPDRLSAASSSPTTTAQMVKAPEPAPGVAANGSVEQHLKTALQELTQRQHDIDEQLSRIETLQSEKETVTKQIDAVTMALQAFQP